MSSAKRALIKAVRSWIAGAGPAPRMFRRCDTCAGERWLPLARGVRRIAANGWTDDGRRADLILRDDQGRIRLVVQLVGGTRLPNRSESGAGAPLIVLDAAVAARDPLRWRPLRAHGLPAWRCRCSHARVLPVDDEFSLRVVACPLNQRRIEAGARGVTPSASVVHQCGRCGFFVGIGYSDPARRRVSLYCSFGTELQPGAPPGRVGPARAPAVPAAALANDTPASAARC